VLSRRSAKDLLEALSDCSGQAAGAAISFAVALTAGVVYLRLGSSRDRPELRAPLDPDSVKDPQAEITRVIIQLQDDIIRPIDDRFTGRPFHYDLLAFPFTPLVLVVGNHSAGKSTFINRLLGIQTQETGVAPTDDGFTLLERDASTNEVEDGPTLLGCSDNSCFRELKRFGPSFWCHLKRKRLVLPKESEMPFGLQIVDTPGMIDMPVKSESTSGGRGYNFLEVVRWFAQRADLILLLFDPDRPGTTGESLDVLTQSLAGLENKFLIVLNKVDQLDSSVDFARAYGTLSWALSKVIPRKDIPQIYTMYNAACEDEAEHNLRSPAAVREHKLPLEAFRKKREEVVAEVLRAKFRHWDNVISATEETLRNVSMVATVSGAVRWRVRCRIAEVCAWGLAILVTPGVAGGWLSRTRWNGPNWALAASWAAYAVVVGGSVRFLKEHCRQFEQLQVSDLDGYFEATYAHCFIYADTEDVRARWSAVRSRTASVLRAAPSAASLPLVSRRELARIDNCLEEDIWYLRRLAKRLRVSAASRQAMAAQAASLSKVPFCPIAGTGR